jgi:D-alanyl-D-alanine carboxypeptidase
MPITHTTSGTTSNHHVRSTRAGRRTLAMLVASAAGVAAVAVATPAVAAPTPAQPVARLQRALDEIVAAGAPGATVLVRTSHGTIRLTSGVGTIEPMTPMRAGDPSRIGGLTKSFTATVVLQLVRERRLALDDRLGQWLPGVISNGDDISVRQLLNHTSGIFDYAQDPSVLAPYLEADLTHVLDRGEAIRVAAGHGPLFAPGAGFAYSNTNYLLLAMIVEAITERPFGDELTDRIFRPLGLRHTSYPTSSDVAPSHIHGYLQVDTETLFDVTPWSPTFYGPAGAIVSSTDDVARFYRALLTGQLLDRAGLRAMKTIDPVATGGVPDSGILGGGWGLGLLREELPCGVAWGHDSEIPGYMTAAWNSADASRQVVVVVNSNFGHDEPVSEAMRKLLVMAYCAR